MKFLSFVIAFSCIAFALAESTTAETTNTISQPVDVAGKSPTTTAKVTTTKAITATTTKPHVELPVNNYNFTKNGSVCLLAKFAAQFVRKRANATNKWNVDESAHVDETSSDCDKLVVLFDYGTFTIEFGEEDKRTFISEVTANLKNPATRASATNITQAKATEGSSYLCDSGFDIEMSSNVTFKMTKVQLQPISVQHDKFGTVENCNDLSAIVPIIVGAVLAGLVVIVVVAYFIGRSRNRTGYEEI